MRFEQLSGMSELSYVLAGTVVAEALKVRLEKAPSSFQEVTSVLTEMHELWCQLYSTTLSDAETPEDLRKFATIYLLMYELVLKYEYVATSHSADETALQAKLVQGLLLKTRAIEELALRALAGE